MKEMRAFLNFIPCFGGREAAQAVSQLIVRGVAEGPALNLTVSTAARIGSTLPADVPSLWPVNNAPGSVVNLMHPGHVDTVLIAGKVRKWRSQLVGIDLARAMRLAEEARTAVMRRAGFAVDLLS
jgi:hypothetical protein